MDIKNLEKKANQLRNEVLDICIDNGGHIASSFSCIDILVSLYYDNVLNHDSERPDWKTRDRFILSKGQKKF